MAKKTHTEAMFDLTEIPAQPQEKRTTFSLDKGIDNLVGALCDPIIVYPGGWATKDFIPEWLRNRITLDRMLELMVAQKEGREPMGTDSEALAYMMPACMEFPFDHDWAQIYLYLGTKVMDGKDGKVMPDDIRVDKLNVNQEEDLRRLKEWIYQTKVKHRKERLKDIRKEERQQKEETEEKVERPAFFEL